MTWSQVKSGEEDVKAKVAFQNATPVLMRAFGSVFSSYASLIISSF